MASTTTGASPKSGAPGRSKASQNGHFKTIKFRGLQLHLPGKVKLRLLKQLTSGTNEEMIAAVEQLLGDQMEQVWDLDVDVSKGMDNLGVLLGDLSVAVFGAYETNAGESQASSQR